MKGYIGLMFIAAIMMSCICMAGLSGHDNQRVAQILIGNTSLIRLLTFCPGHSAFGFFSRSARWFFFLILFAGAVSSINAHQPLWAFTELSLLLSCSVITMNFAQQREHHGGRLDVFFLVLVISICTIKSIHFLISTFTAFAISVSVIDTDLLLDGFSNKRMYGQLQTYTLPLLALPLLLSVRSSYKGLLFGLLSVWWMIAITGGTRGTWLGIGVAVALAACLGQAGRRWAAWQAGSAATGVLLFMLTFSLLPAWLGMNVENFAGDRLSTSLSAREVLWQQAWHMIQERPLLGFGPMHFADIWNAVGANPHQAILQWASEWGVPSTLCVMGLAFYGLLATWKLLRKRVSSREPVDLLRLCLAASLVGALTQSMVDGIIVMPYSQLWLALVIGWLIALHERPEPLPKANPVIQGLWLASVALAMSLLMYVVIRDLPTADARADQFAHDFGGRYFPRFWLQGVIAQPGVVTLGADLPAVR